MQLSDPRCSGASRGVWWLAAAVCRAGLAVRAPRTRHRQLGSAANNPKFGAFPRITVDDFSLHQQLLAPFRPAV